MTASLTAISYLEAPSQQFPSNELLDALLRAADDGSVDRVFAALHNFDSDWPLLLPLIPPNLARAVLIHIAQEKGGGHTVCTDPNGTRVPNNHNYHLRVRITL